MNVFLGTIPTTMTSMTFLQALLLDSNHLNGWFSAALRMACSHRMVGTIPSGLGQLTRLQALLLNKNDLEGDGLVCARILHDPLPV